MEGAWGPDRRHAIQRPGHPGQGLDPHLCHPQPWPHWPYLQAKSQFKRRSTANNVEIHIPVPNDADSPKFKTTVGSVKWVPENSEIVWSIKSFPVSSLPAGVRLRPIPPASCAHRNRWLGCLGYPELDPCLGLCEGQEGWLEG